MRAYRDTRDTRDTATAVGVIVEALREGSPGRSLGGAMGVVVGEHVVVVIVVGGAVMGVGSEC